MNLEKLKDLPNKYTYYILVILLSFLPLFFIFETSDLHHTHDGLVHLARLGAFYKSLTDGQIPVRWAADLNYGYGMPLFNFIYHFPYLVASIFLFLGFGLVNSFKISLSLSFIFSAIFMFSFAKIFFEDNKKAFLVTIFYQFATFRLIEILERGSFGEVYTYSFFPLVLYGLTGIYKKLSFQKGKKTKNNFSLLKIININNLYKNVKTQYVLLTKIKFYFIITIFSTTLLILSHNALSLVFFIISFSYLLFFTKRETFIFGATALFLGLMLSSYYWIPALFEHKYTYGDIFMKDMYLNHFPPLQNFFIPNINNSLEFQTGGISPQFGIFHVIAIALSLLVLVNVQLKHRLNLVNYKGVYRKTIMFCLFLTFTSLFLMQPISVFFWKNLSFLRQFQFPWRFLGVAVFSTSLLSASFLDFNFFRKKAIFVFIVFLVIISSFYYWNPPEGYDKINEKYYWNYPLNTTYFGETDLIWSAGSAYDYPKKRVEVIGGIAEVKNYFKKSNLQKFNVESKTDSQIVVHTQYFPGWRVFVGDEQIPVEFQDQNWRGQITFRLPEGKHLVKVVFGESGIRAVADIISLTTLSVLTLLFLIKIGKLILKRQ